MEDEKYALIPCVEESVNWHTTQNMYIEGDNLMVLQLLQKSHHNKVMLIYIDPPYNTGNGFVYKDNFTHKGWLNMMRPRLILARKLMREDGLIFISIDDREVHNLRRLCDEVFGEDNFRNQIVVRRGSKSVQSQFSHWDKLGQDVEYILFYTKDAKHRFPQQRKPLGKKRKGAWNSHWRGTDRPTMRYELFGQIPESGQWRWGKERSLRAIENYRKMLLHYGVAENELTLQMVDQYYENQSKKPDLLRLSAKNRPQHYIPPSASTLLNNCWYDLLVGSSSEIIELFGEKVFDTAKLTAVIERMLGFCDKEGIVLDFFSGSATTAHAVMNANSKDGGIRKYIMVQLPEECPKNSTAYLAGYSTICDIGKERIRRAGAKINTNIDKGFCVYKLNARF